MLRLIGYVLVLVLAVYVIGSLLAGPTTTPGPAPSVTPETGRYANCQEASAAAGPGPYRTGTPGYDPYLDGDANGIACEE